MDRRVIIIGGGIAGLSAAVDLLRRGCVVTVLEAKDRFGGRVHTVNGNSHPIELGAEFLHGQNENISRLIHEAGLATHEVPDRNRILESGKFRSLDIWELMNRIIHRVNPREPDQSFRDFAESKVQPDNRRLALSFIEGFDAADPGRISVHALLRGEHAAEQLEISKQSRIHQGYSALVDHLEQTIRANGGVLMNRASVKNIRWQYGKVEIELQDSANGQKTFAGDAAIITVSLGVLKARAIEFTPSLTHKQAAIDGLQFGNVLKIVLTFEQRWWPEANFGFIQAFGQPIPTWWSDPRTASLTGWAGGPRADALLLRTHDDLQRLAIESLQHLFPEQASKIRPQLRSVHFHDWSRDPEIRGAYSYIPVNGLDLPKLLASPVHQTLFFAGEATAMDGQSGTVIAAYESGLRAAREVSEMRTGTALAE